MNDLQNPNRQENMSRQGVAQRGQDQFLKVVSSRPDATDRSLPMITVAPGPGLTRSLSSSGAWITGPTEVVNDIWTQRRLRDGSLQIYRPTTILVPNPESDEGPEAPVQVPRGQPLL